MAEPGPAGLPRAAGGPANRRILVVEDDAESVKLLSEALNRKGHRVVAAADLKSAAGQLAKERFDGVLLDICLPDGTGLDLLEQLRERKNSVPVIVMTANGTVDIAVEAMRLGARDFIRKPFRVDKLHESLARLLDTSPGPVRVGTRELVAGSSVMVEVRRLIELFAPTDASVLLLGESGTGKELTARALHQSSRRASGPFVAFDCTTVPAALLDAELFGHEKGAFTDARTARPGKFETAAGGTLFFDEIANLSFEAQAKLLRVLQERTFQRVGGNSVLEADVRIVAATNANLEGAIAAGLFREDLYFRLAELTVLLPPLRERGPDLDALIEHFIVRFNAEHGKSVAGLTPQALTALRGYRWPGNVRELQNAIRRALLLCEHQIEPSHLPAAILETRRSAPAVSPAPDSQAAPDEMFSQPIQWPARGEGLDIKKLSREFKRELERQIIVGLVRRYGYNKAELARSLGLDYKVMLEKLADLGLTSLIAKP